MPTARATIVDFLTSKSKFWGDKHYYAQNMIRVAGMAHPSGLVMCMLLVCCSVVRFDSLAPLQEDRIAKMEEFIGGKGEQQKPDAPKGFQ